MIDTSKAAPLGLVLAAMMGAIAPTCAQTYPIKPVRMVIAFAPGGGTDIVGRIIGQKLGELTTRK